MNMHTFKPCPWCNSTDVAVESEQIVDRIVTGVDEDNGPVYWAECQHCGARGPLVDWAVDAIPKWNERDAAQARVGEMEGLLREAQTIALSGAKYHKKPYDETPCAKRYQEIADRIDAALAGGETK